MPFFFLFDLLFATMEFSVKYYHPSIFFSQIKNGQNPHVFIYIMASQLAFFLFLSFFSFYFYSLISKSCCEAADNARKMRTYKN